ncbi:MAG: hypothetical protein ACOC1J_00925 [Prolixibacteraceae bacterium]
MPRFPTPTNPNLILSLAPKIREVFSELKACNPTDIPAAVAVLVAINSRRVFFSIGFSDLKFATKDNQNKRKKSFAGTK